MSFDDHLLQLNPEHSGSNYWDLNLLKWVVAQQSEPPEGLAVIPGAYQADYIDHINEHLDSWPWVLAVVTSDEENRFPVHLLDHPNMVVWAQYGAPHHQDYVDRFIPIGAPRNDFSPQTKEIDWCFSGQVFHEKRATLIDAMRNDSRNPNHVLISTEGFTQGLEQDKYRDLLAKTRVALCPGGTISPDSFRLYEALESGCIPIVDDRSFFTMLFDEFPFLCVDDWAEAPALIEIAKTDRDLAGDCYAWWHDQRWLMVKNMKEDLWNLRSPS